MRFLTVSIAALLLPLASQDLRGQASNERVATAPLATTCEAIVRPAQVLRVRSPVAGHVSRLFVGIGDAVKAFDPLVVVAATERSAELGIHEARLVHATEQLSGLSEAEKLTRVRVVAAERAAKAMADRAALLQSQCDECSQQLQSLQTALNAGRATAAEVREVRTRLDDLRVAALNARAAADEARDTVEIARIEQVRATSAVIAQRHHIDATRAQKEKVRVEAEAGEVRCLLPAARVSRLLVGHGDLVERGTELLELVDLSRLLVVVRVPAELAAGQPSDVACELLWTSQRPTGITAKVSRRSGVVDADGCTEWICDLDPGTAGLLPGTPLRANLVAGKRTQ